MTLLRGASALAVATVVTLGTGCSADAAPGVIAVGQPAPSYAAPTLTGDTLALTDLHGQVVVLNIWATWCPPCREEMPGLEALQQQFADDGLHVIGVSIDSRAAVQQVRSFLDENAISFTILHDPDELVMRRFRTAGVPETFLIGHDGRILRRWFGKIDPQSEPIQAAVHEALEAAGQRRS